MKIIVTLLSLALATGALFSSCSKTELGEVTPPETKVPGEDEISPRFTSNNLTYAEAIDFVQPFLEREPEFRFAKIFDRDLVITFNIMDHSAHQKDLLGFVSEVFHVLQ